MDTNDISTTTTVSQAPPISAYSKDDFEQHVPHQWLYAQCKQYGAAVEAELLSSLATIAKGYGIANFKSIYRALKKDAQKQDKQSNMRRPPTTGNRTKFSGQPIPGGLFCGPFIADDDGIRLKKADGTIETVCQHPIMPTCTITDIETGTSKTRLWYRTYDGEHFIWVDSVCLGSQKSIIALRGRNIDVDSSSAPLFIRYLKAVCMSPTNYSALQAKHGVSHCGYVDSGYSTFVPYSEEYEYSGPESQQALYDAISNPGGSRDEQYALINSLRSGHTPIIKIALAASLGSILLYPLGPNPFFLHIWADKGAGKTVLLQLAASLWADPSGRGHYIKNYHATSAGMEAMDAFLQALPLCLDESTLADKSKLDDIIYAHCEGADKLRSTKECIARKGRSWCNICISTGERPLTDESSNGGAKVRVVSLNGTGQRFFGSAVQAGIVANKVKRHYGWIGRDFVAALPNHLEEASHLYQMFLSQLIEKGYDDKQACAAAVCLVADTLASKYVFRDSDNRLQLTVDDIAQYLDTPLASSAAYRTALWLRDLVAANQAHFMSSNGSVPDTLTVWGRIGDDGYTLINRSILKTEMAKANMPLNPEAFAAWARQQGIIVPDSQGKTDRSNFPRATICGQTAQVLKIRLNAINSIGAQHHEQMVLPSSDAQPVEDNLPF